MPDHSQLQGGILLCAAYPAELAAARGNFLEHAAALGIDQFMEAIDGDNGHGVRFRLRAALQHEWAPAFDTLQLGDKCHFHPLTDARDLEREILLAMLLGPVTFEYPSYAELVAALHIRQYIIQAGRHTELSFHVSQAERPGDFWTYSEEDGFTLLPGKPLIEALRMATQPGVSGQRYSFSCYRATEYVILLGIAQELAVCNPELLQRLQRQWELHAIKSGGFHETFLREYGSMQEPLPPKYYVPGDRLWFRNPDERSSDITGYEGSWVIYLGGGWFTNLWDKSKAYSLTTKCVEIFHWRDGVCTDAEGSLYMDEALVAEQARATLLNPERLASILERMMHLRDPKNVYADGGCIDTSREYPRWVCPGTSDINLPQR